MKKSHLLLSTISLAFFLNGCSVMTPIGKEEFTCPNEKKGGVCAGPRTIYELTNSRANLENLEGNEDFDGYVITTDEEGNTIAKKSNGDEDDDSHQHQNSGGSSEKISLGNGTRAIIINDKQHQYAPRAHSQQTTENYQTPTVIPQVRGSMTKPDAFHQWPNNQEPLAPEPLSVLEPPKVMRILINSYKDNAGNLHLPGYLFVQVEAEKWAFGESSSIRPQRVIPTQILEQSQEAGAERDYRTQGVSPLEHSER